MAGNSLRPSPITHNTLIEGSYLAAAQGCISIPLVDNQRHCSRVHKCGVGTKCLCPCRCESDEMRQVFVFVLWFLAYTSALASCP